MAVVLASMSVDSYLGMKLNDGCHWHLTECCFLDICLSGHSVIAIQMSDDYKPGYISLVTECLTSIWVWLVSSISTMMCVWVVTKPMATMSDSLGSIWVMDVFLIYKWWCVWHPPELWVNPSGPYKWSLNADYQSERWLWFLASMSVGSYLGIKLNDGCHWHLTECCFLDTQLLQSRWVITTTWLYLTCDWKLDIHMGVACFLNFYSDVCVSGN